MIARDESPSWRTSTRSSGGNCVEVRADASAVLMRDSKNRDRGTLSFDRAAFRSFLDGIKNGEFDCA
jgi:uncharacterized protein DUF397